MNDYKGNVNVKKYDKYEKVCGYLNENILRREERAKCPPVLSHEHSLLVPFKIHNFIDGNIDTDNSLF